MVIVATGLAVAAGVAGGAVAASQSDDPAAERQAFLNDVAGRLGTTSAKLEAALKAAAIDRVDAALKAGKITQAEAQALKEAINSGKVPLGPGFGFGPGFGHLGKAGGHFLSAAATYLGLTEAQLRTQLESGKSLADIAKAQNKSVDGLKAAILKEVESNLDQAVKDGHITSAQRDEFLNEFKSHLDDLVNGTLSEHAKGFRIGPEHGQGPGFSFGFRFGADRPDFAPRGFRGPFAPLGGPTA
jgi:hypothetical protein